MQKTATWNREPATIAKVSPVATLLIILGFSLMAWGMILMLMFA